MDKLQPSKQLNFGDFVVVSTLAENPRNQIYLAVKPDSKKFQPVVLKVPTSSGIEALCAEAQILAQLSHENIYSIIKDCTESAKSFLALEYVDGVSLEDVVNFETSGSRTPNLQLAIQISYQICQTLVYLAKNYECPPGSIGPIAHGDLSPKNLILTFEGQIKLIDFGCARVLSRSANPNLAVASLRYASPSRIKNQRVDIRDDFFALGMLLWELCTGKSYWGKSSFEEISSNLKSFTPKDPMLRAPQIPEAVSKIILHCLSEDYFDSYSSAEEIIENLLEVRKLHLTHLAPVDLRQYARDTYSAQLFKSRQSINQVNDVLTKMRQPQPATPSWKNLFSKKIG